MVPMNDIHSNFFCNGLTGCVKLLRRFLNDRLIDFPVAKCSSKRLGVAYIRS